MAENLRVTKYNNGDDIPTGLSNTDWESKTDGAYAVYASLVDIYRELSHERVDPEHVLRLRRFDSRQLQ